MEKGQRVPPFKDVPHYGWKDALLIAAFVYFVYIFVRTGGFIPSALPTPTFSYYPTLTALAAHRLTSTPVRTTLTATPTRTMLTPTPTENMPKYYYLWPNIRGSVVEIYTLNGQITGAFVRGKLEADTSVAQAFVKFTDQTLLFIKIADQYQPAPLSALARGDRVEIIFTTTPGESSSAQPIADEIVILK
jgi:hypothetical protein